MNNDRGDTIEVIEQHGSLLLIPRRAPFCDDRTARRPRLSDEARRARGRTADARRVGQCGSGRGWLAEEQAVHLFLRVFSSRWNARSGGTFPSACLTSIIVGVFARPVVGCALPRPGARLRRAHQARGLVVPLRLDGEMPAELIKHLNDPCRSALGEKVHLQIEMIPAISG
jgi:hypothetical protein